MKHPACIYTERGWVELEADSAYRYITNKETDTFLTSRGYRDKEGIYWPALKVTHRPPKFCDNSVSVEVVSSYEIEKFNLVSRYTEFVPSQILEALKFLCEIQKYCLENGYFLETHIWNVILSHGRPLLIDIGDFFKYKGSPSDNHRIMQSIVGSFREKEDNHSPVHFSKFIVDYQNFTEKLV